MNDFTMFLTDSRLADCRWPMLPTRYDRALREAVEHILLYFDPLGIIAAGSIVRGNPGPTSDFDIFVVHAEPWRQRSQRFFDQVPVEIFINPPHATRDYFVKEHRAGRPCTAHMFSTGFVVLDRDPVIDELRREAEAWLQSPSSLTEDEMTWERYAVVDTLDNAWDIIDLDPANAALIVHRAVDRMVDFAFRNEGRFIPPTKRLLEEMDEVDPVLETLLRQYYSTADVNFQFSLAQRMAERTVGATSFFEWESQAEEMPEPTEHHTQLNLA